MTPVIPIHFQNKADLGCNPATLIAALQAYVDKWLAPQWGVSAKLYVSLSVKDDEWPLIIADNTDQVQALGYHDLEQKRPCGFVFVETSQRAGVPASDTASHELAELLLDPGCNLGVYSPRSRWIAREVCDPVQGCPITVNGLPMANFVLPSWYGAGSAPYDAAGACTQPWEILEGGYIPVWDGNGWSAVFGSEKAKSLMERKGIDGALRRYARRKGQRPIQRLLA